MPGHHIFSDMYTNSQVLPDPGNAGALAPSQSPAMTELKSTAAETRTVAAPVKEGLEWVLAMAVDGGDIVVTFASAYDEVGTTAMTFADVGQFVKLISVRVSASAFAWRVVGSDNVAGPVLGLNITSDATNIRLNNLIVTKQATPAAKTVAVTLTAAELMTQIITGTHTAGATAAYTLPTGTLLDAAVSDLVGIDEGFAWSLINLSAAALDTVTVTAGSGHTIVGNPIVQSAHVSTGGIYGNSGRFFSRKTAANTFVTYRIA